MLQRGSFDGVAIFVMAAECGSFSEAARRLGVSPSAVSQAISSLEERLGTPLFRRTTRSLGLTDAGSDFLVAAAPALSQLHQAAEDASGRSGRPTGSLRLTMPRAPFEQIVAPILVGFQESHPRVSLEISVEARMVDIVKQGYDAGLRYGNSVEKDMVAIPVAPASESVLVAAPSYLSDRPHPTCPDDLLDHRVIMCRSQATGSIIPWSLQGGDGTVQFIPSTATIVHDLASQIDLARRGFGIVSAPERMVAGFLDAGSLVRILPSWAAPIEPVFLYFPSRRHQSASLRAFVRCLKNRGDAADVEIDSRRDEPDQP